MSNNLSLLILLEGIRYSSCTFTGTVGIAHNLLAKQIQDKTLIQMLL